jgi:hypothetical protein
MSADSAIHFLGALLDLIDDLIAELRSRMIATQLIRSVAATAAKYRSVQQTRRSAPAVAKMCLVLEEIDHSSAWLEGLERKRLTRRLEPVRQALYVADQIIEKTFAPQRPARSLPRYAVSQESSRNNHRLERS